MPDTPERGAPVRRREMDRVGQLQEIDAAALVLTVRQALDSATAVVEVWHSAPLGGGGLHRVTGTASDGDAHRPWSVVAKVLRPPPIAGTVFGQPDPGAMYYWRSAVHDERRRRRGIAPAGGGNRVGHHPGAAQS